MSDKKIWLGLKNGDKSCLESLYRENVNILYNYGKKLHQNEDVVLDEIQNLFIHLWDIRSKLPEEVNSKAYLITSFRNRIIDNFRRDKHNIIQIGEKHDIESHDFIENQLINNENDIQQNNKLKKAIEKLTSKQKEIIYLKYNLNHSYEEIAEILEINYQSARNLIHRTITELRKDFISLLIIIFFT
jgi:RNA polymerase sigma factor (sigma-70 family)